MYDVNKHAACNVNDSVTVAKSFTAMALADSLINALFLVCSDLATILDILLEFFFFYFNSIEGGVSKTIASVTYNQL